MRNKFLAASVLVLACAAHALAADVKKVDASVAPPLVGSGWIGSPVSLDAIRGNTVVLAFWNADVAC